MNGLGGLNKTPNGVVIGLVQLKLEQIDTPEDLRRQTTKIVEMVAKARRNMQTMDIVVFPAYALHGLSMSTDPAIMCRIDGPEVAAFRKACVDNAIWGCFSIRSSTRTAIPTTSAWSSTTRARSNSTIASSIRGCRSSHGSPATWAFR